MEITTHPPDPIVAINKELIRARRYLGCQRKKSIYPDGFSKL